MKNKKKLIYIFVPLTVVILAALASWQFGLFERYLSKSEQHELSHDQELKHEEADHEGEEELAGHFDHEEHDENETAAFDTGDEHAGHDHAGDQHTDDQHSDDEHAGHDHANDQHTDDEHTDEEHVEDVHADAHDHKEGEENRVELTPEQRKRIGLEIATANPGTISIDATFPGEVVLDPARLVHVVPRAAGIVREVNKTLGDRVEAGEILAWIESEELAEAKLSFYAKQTEVSLDKIKLPRIRKIFENTRKLLEMLEKEPSEEELRSLDELEMGEYRGNLVKAYADYQAAKKTYARERGLYEKKISSESDVVEAEAAYKKAQAYFVAAKDIARYRSLLDFSEVERETQVTEFEAVAAEQRLRLKGVDDAVVEKLLNLVPKTQILEPCHCDDSNCEDGHITSVFETLDDEKRFAWYALRAPFAGIITDMHLTLGEKVGVEESVFSIADTSSIWVQFNVYQKDLAQIKTDQNVRIELGAGIQSHSGKIIYVAPILDERTRTAQARVVLENADGALLPGLYASVHVAAERVNAPIVIPRDAVQVLEEKEVVFVVDGDGFLPVSVKLGQADRDRVVVNDGLKPGQRYVKNGAFEMKAKIMTSGLGAHAGHGH